MGKLNEIKCKNPFKVPENYFEEVNRKIIHSTAGAKPDTGKRRFTTRLHPILAAAASIAVFVLLSYTAMKIFLPVSKNVDLPEISLREFSESYLYDVDILTLVEYADLSAYSEEVPDVSKEEIIDYLLLDNIDINEIYEIL